MSAVSTPGDEKLSCTATPELATNGEADVDGAGCADGGGDDEVAASLATGGDATAGDTARGTASLSAPVNENASPKRATTARPMPPAVAFTGHCSQSTRYDSRRAARRRPVT